MNTFRLSGVPAIPFGNDTSQVAGSMTPNLLDRIYRTYSSFITFRMKVIKSILWRRVNPPEAEGACCRVQSAWHMEQEIA